MAVIVLVPAAPVAHAGVSEIWGSTMQPKTPAELSNQSMICQYINSLFNSYGYNSFNNQPNGGTVKSNVLPITQSAGQSYQSVATVWFDHGVGTNQTIAVPYQSEWHFMLCDDNGNETNHIGNIYDYEIYNKTTTGNYYFSYISACMSAALSGTYPNGTLLFNDETGSYGLNNQSGGSGNIVGMPFAWTRELTSPSPDQNAFPGNMSRDGYWKPDSGPYCYIGFPWGSAALAQTTDSYSYPTTTYCDFVSGFFYYALNCSMSVNQALDAASYMCFPPEQFAGTALYRGFVANWPIYEHFPNGTWGWVDDPFQNCNMVVYGNGNIHLAYPSTWGPTTSSVSGPSSGYANTQYSCSATSNDGNLESMKYTFNWGDGSAQTITGYTQSGVAATATHNYNSAGQYSITVQAQDAQGIASSWSTPISTNIQNPPTQYTITAFSDAHSTINPPGTVSVNQGSSQTFTMSTNAGYHITHVYIDGIDNGAITNYTFNNIQSGHTISVNSAVSTYAITASSDSGSSISPSGITYVNYGGNQAYTFTPNTGYYITNVYVDGVPQGAIPSYTFYTVTSTHIISVSSDTNTYPITSSAGSGGTISPSGTTYVNYGGSQTFTITPNSGYSISQVTVDGTNQGAISSYPFNNVQAAHTISATFSNSGGNAFTFGNTVSGTYTDQNDANAQSVSYFTCTNSGSVTDIKAYIAGASSGNCIAALYAVNGGSAGALLEQSNPVSLGTTYSWVDFTLPTSYSVTSGTTYGLAIMGNVAVNLYIVGGTGQRDHNAVSSYAQGFANPFGAIWGTDYGGAMSIYALGTT